MAKITTKNNELNRISDNMYVAIPVGGGNPVNVYFRSTPEIGTSKSTSYSNDSIRGKPAPVLTWAYGNERTYSIKFDWYVLGASGANSPQQILLEHRIIQSALYPQQPTGDTIPVICQLQCGDVIKNQAVVLVSAELTQDTDTPMDDTTCLHYHTSMTTTWQTVYANNNLPGQNTVVSDNFL